MNRERRFFPIQSLIPSIVGPKDQPCKLNWKGRCRMGADCAYEHVSYHTCWEYYKAGRCPRPRCRWDHSRRFGDTMSSRITRSESRVIERRRSRLPVRIPRSRSRSRSRIHDRFSQETVEISATSDGTRVSMIKSTIQVSGSSTTNTNRRLSSPPPPTIQSVIVPATRSPSPIKEIENGSSHQDKSKKSISPKENIPRLEVSIDNSMNSIDSKEDKNTINSGETKKNAVKRKNGVMTPTDSKTSSNSGEIQKISKEAKRKNGVVSNNTGDALNKKQKKK